MNSPSTTEPEDPTSSSATPEDFARVFQAIKADSQNASYTVAGIDPLYTAGPDARVAIVGQAPGRIAQDTQIPWNDKSGERLREWLGMDRATFYDPSQVAIVPMDFYFPGAGKSGDLPPRPGFAQKWHPVLFQMMPRIQLVVLVGSYATRHYLGLRASERLTDVVRDYQKYGPRYFPLAHPSPRNRMWVRRNPWFEAEVLPQLRVRVAQALKG